MFHWDAFNLFFLVQCLSRTWKTNPKNLTSDEHSALPQSTEGDSWSETPVKCAREKERTNFWFWRPMVLYTVGWVSIEILWNLDTSSDVWLIHFEANWGGHQFAKESVLLLLLSHFLNLRNTANAQLQYLFFSFLFVMIFRGCVHYVSDTIWQYAQNMTQCPFWNCLQWIICCK